MLQCNMRKPAENRRFSGIFGRFCALQHGKMLRCNMLLRGIRRKKWLISAVFRVLALAGPDSDRRRWQALAGPDSDRRRWQALAGPIPASRKAPALNQGFPKCRESYNQPGR